MQATIEAMYLIAQAVLYVCVLYFMAGFDRTPGKSLHTLTGFSSCTSFPVQYSWSLSTAQAVYLSA